MIELVAHVWRYSRVWNYSASALYLHPPKNVAVTYTVFYSEDDLPTVETLNFWKDKIPLQACPMKLPDLLQRAIGRNLAAFWTSADIIAFIDADICWGEGALDALHGIPLSGDDPRWSPLWFPRDIMGSRTKELGDDYSRRVTGPAVVDINPADFSPMRQRKAIGNSQICPGSVTRKLGYCPNTKHQRPVTNGQWKQTTSDQGFRGILGTKGTPIDLPNLYRIRQTTEGVVDTLA